MQGFKAFVLRGNLVELAVAFIIGTSFAAVVTAFTAVIMGIIGKAGGNPNFDTFQPGGLPVGAFITALVAFLIVAAILYFLVVTPYERAKEKFFPAKPEDDSPVGPDEVGVLLEIRDLLKGGATPPTS